MPRMGDHSRANASSPMGQNPKHCSEQADQNHHPEALVRVTRTECRGRKENAGGNLPSQGDELPVQVPPEDRLFANTPPDRESYPYRYFDTPTREHDDHLSTERRDPHGSR